MREVLHNVKGVFFCYKISAVVLANRCGLSNQGRQIKLVGGACRIHPVVAGPPIIGLG